MKRDIDSPMTPIKTEDNNDTFDSDNNTTPYTWNGTGNHGTFPYASSTGDADYGLFFTPREMELFNDYNTELLGTYLIFI